MNRIQIRATQLKLISGIAVHPHLEYWELDQFYHEGLCELGRRGEPVLWRAKSTLNTNTTDSEYPLPDDFLAYIELEPLLIAGRPLEMITQGQLDQAVNGWRSLSNSEKASTQVFYEAGTAKSGTHIGKRLFGLYPKPGQVFEVTIPYRREPVTLASLANNTTEYWDLSKRYHRLPCYYGAWLWAQNAEAELKKDPATLLAIFEAGAEKFREEFGEKFQAAYRPVTPEAFTVTLEDQWEVD